MKQKKIRKSGLFVTVDKAARADINVIVRRLGGPDAFGYSSVKDQLKELDDKLFYLEQYLGVYYQDKLELNRGYRKAKKCKSRK